MNHTKALHDVLAERQRQIEDEGYTLEHDDASIGDECADEIERLTAALRKVNSQTEEFERKWYLARHELEDEREQLTAERDALREDAECYRWIAAHCRSTAEHWSGRWSIVIEGPAPTRHDDEDAFRSAIDAARALRKGAQNV